MNILLDSQVIETDDLPTPMIIFGPSILDPLIRECIKSGQMGTCHVEDGGGYLIPEYIYVDLPGVIPHLQRCAGRDLGMESIARRGQKKVAIRQALIELTSQWKVNRP